MARDEDPARG
jgi:hypothetical protein